MSKTKKAKVSEIKINEDNPRYIKQEKFEKLKKSITDFPEMLEMRPIVIDENNIVLGGNMRFQACKELGMQEITVMQIEGLSEEKKREFIIKDNASFGDWDWDVLANEWETSDIKDWGIDAWEEPKFEPDLEPDKSQGDVTDEDIEKQEKKNQLGTPKQGGNIECICPNCGEEFEVQI